MNRRVYDPGDLGCCWCSTAVRPLSLLLGGGLLLAVGAAVVVAAGSGPAGWVNDLPPITGSADGTPGGHRAGGGWRGVPRGSPPPPGPVQPDGSTT